MSEGQMRLALLIQRTDALLEGQQTLVDFGSVLLRLLARVNDVRTALRTGQVDKAHLRKYLAAVLDEVGQDGVRSRRLSIGARGSTRSAFETQVDGVHNLFDGRHMLLGQVGDLDAPSRIFSALNFGSLVQKIEELAAIDLIKGNKKLQALILVQKLDNVVRCQSVHAADRAVRRTHHGERFARTRLTVGETCGFGTLECLCNKRLHTLIIKSLVVLGMLEHVVECEMVLFDVFGKVDLFLDFLDGKRIVADDGENILFVSSDLFAEQGSLTYDNTNLWWLFWFVHLEFVSTLNIVLINLKLYFTSLIGFLQNINFLNIDCTS